MKKISDKSLEIQEVIKSNPKADVTIGSML